MGAVRGDGPSGAAKGDGARGAARGEGASGAASGDWGNGVARGDGASGAASGDGGNGVARGDGTPCSDLAGSVGTEPCDGSDADPPEGEGVGGNPVACPVTACWAACKWRFSG